MILSNCSNSMIPWMCSSVYACMYLYACVYMYAKAPSHPFYPLVDPFRSSPVIVLLSPYCCISVIFSLLSLLFSLLVSMFMYVFHFLEF